MVGIRLVTESGELDHDPRSFPGPELFSARPFHWNRPFAECARGVIRLPGDQSGEFEAGDLDAVNGAFMLVRREALLDVGPLDEGYWLYMEDLDWCRRFHGGLESVL